MISTNHKIAPTRWFWAGAGRLAGGLLVLAMGMPPRVAAQSYEQLSAEINRASGELLELLSRNRDRNSRLARALASGEHDTPAMRQTRARIRKLTTELEEAEAELKRQLEELPAFREEVAAAKREQEEAKKLGAKQEELRKQREALLKSNIPQNKEPRIDTP